MPKPKSDPRFKWTVNRTVGGRFRNEWDTRVAPTRGYLKQHVEAVYKDRVPRDSDGDILSFGKSYLWPTRQTLVVSTPFRTHSVQAKRKIHRQSTVYLIRAGRGFETTDLHSPAFHHFFQDLKG